ncbi:hypothetical protein [Bacillus massiliglaciei]|uniref:hypothetical protein n=1 Tax=Bacillus massiliglaciei TaxID=1816693 RepID=UPI000DA5F781|nr:hypothetical protein [Bacillus massiliglaciei]
MRALLKKTQKKPKQDITEIIREAQGILRDVKEEEFQKPKKLLKAERIPKDDPNIRLLLGKK